MQAYLVRKIYCDLVLMILTISSDVSLLRFIRAGRTCHIRLRTDNNIAGQTVKDDSATMPAAEFALQNTVHRRILYLLGWIF